MVLFMEDDLIIDPALITKENMPQILAAIVIELRRMNTKIDERMAGAKEGMDDRLGKCETRLEDIEETLGKPLADCTTRRQANEKRLLDVETILAEHESILWGPLKLTTKQILPMLWRYRLFFGVTGTVLTIWIAAIDWAVRAAQWALEPPLRIP